MLLRSFLFSAYKINLHSAPPFAFSLQNFVFFDLFLKILGARYLFITFIQLSSSIRLDWIASVNVWVKWLLFCALVSGSQNIHWSRLDCTLKLVHTSCTNSSSCSLFVNWNKIRNSAVHSFLSKTLIYYCNSVMN